MIAEEAKLLKLTKCPFKVYLGEKASEMDFVIIRVAPLNDEVSDSTKGEPLLTESPLAYGWITAGGVAEIVKRCIKSDKVVGNTFSAVDSNTVFVSNPFLRPLETHESIPFEKFYI